MVLSHIYRGGLHWNVTMKNCPDCQKNKTADSLAWSLGGRQEEKK